MGNWLVNHWFSAAVLVSVWGWGAHWGRAVRGDSGGYGPGGLVGEMGADGLPGAGLWGQTSVPSAQPARVPRQPGEGWALEN